TPALQAPSSRDLPRGPVLGVFEHDADGEEFVADAVGLGEVFRLASGSAVGDPFVEPHRIKALLVCRIFRNCPYQSCTQAIVFLNVVDCTVEAKQQQRTDKLSRGIRRSAAWRHRFGSKMMKLGNCRWRVEII